MSSGIALGRATERGFLDNTEDIIAVAIVIDGV
jgi:hypothetical protein